ncbi:ATP synthase F0 subunit A [Enterococcus faecalis]|uniref:ATP synthase F0 subunit A n=1 Tax=Enterococcus faecalis TaxID=1351 RepID=UPI000668916F|nr:ATP synthase F0 subunit A [Enterococcus faecalis]
MQYLIDSYSAYTVNGGLLDKGWQVVNWFFVDIPFFILRMFASFFLFCENVLNQSSFFEGKQETVLNMSKDVLSGFGGKGFRGGSLLALAILISAYYLLYHFFSSRRSFSKVFLHYLAVVVLFVFWFGSVSTSTGTTSGSTFLIQSTNAIAKGVQSTFTSSANLGTEGSKDGEVYQSPIFDATVKQTFNFVNSGSLDGKMENGKKLDESKLLEKPKLSKEEKEKFEKNRKKYIDKVVDDNPYFAQDGAKTMEKAFGVGVGVVNLAVLAVPVTYINIMLNVIQIIVDLLILVFPIIALVSFFPRCQMMMFKFFKSLIGILFLPVVFGIFLSVLFWINKLIDQAFLGLMDKVSSSLLMVMSGGVFLLGTLIVTALVKIILYRKIWKSRYKILSFFSDGQVQQPSFESKMNEKTKETVERTGEIGVGAVKAGIGASTGNLALAADGASHLMPKHDKALNLAKDHFIDDNGQFAGVKTGLNSLLNRSTQEEQQPFKDDMLPEEEIAEVEEPTNVDNEELEEIEDKALTDEVDNFEDSTDDEMDNSLEEFDVPVLDENVSDFDTDTSLADENNIELEPIIENELDSLDSSVESSENDREEPIQELDEQEIADNLNVRVDNFDELAFAREERAFFDGGEDSELITNNNDSLNNVYSFYQTEENFNNLEQTEEQFFGSVNTEEYNFDVVEG